MAHLIRNNFKQALTDFLIGYTQSSPSISLSELINSNTDNDEVKLKVSWLLRSISQELLDEDEKDIHDHIESERFINLQLLEKVFLLMNLNQRRTKK